MDSYNKCIDIKFNSSSMIPMGLDIIISSHYSLSMFNISFGVVYSIATRQQVLQLCNIFIIFTGLVTTGYALDCYECSSVDDATCADEYTGSDTHKETCLVDTGCSKLKSKGKVLGIEATTVVRSCGATYDNSQCSQKDHAKVSVFGVKSESWSCSCTTDLCNTGSAPTLGISLLLAGKCSR